MIQSIPGVTLYQLGVREHETSELCDHVSAWQVFSDVAPNDASNAAGNAKKDVDAIHTQSPGSASQCLQTYLTEPEQMGVANAEPEPPLETRRVGRRNGRTKRTLYCTIWPTQMDELRLSCGRLPTIGRREGGKTP
jgi:hypothetical protein